MSKKKRIFVSGHNGLVGSSIVRLLKKNSQNDLILKNRRELNLINQEEVNSFFRNEKIDQVYLAAGKVGGIKANNNRPANFIYENIMIEANIIHSSFINNVKKLLFLGSSCIYPKFANQPIKEIELLNGYLEPTNEPYAIAKIAGIKLCESYNRQYKNTKGIDYRTVMPTNIYGPGDHYDEENSHVIPALIMKFRNAIKNKQSNVTLWGSGNAKREFLYVDDLARACEFIMNLDSNKYKSSISDMNQHINIGYGNDISIKELSEKVSKLTNFKGNIIFDEDMPEGTPQKLIDSNIINSMGWKPIFSLDDGLKKTYQDFINRFN